MTTEAETGVVQAQVRECWQSSEASREARNQFSPEAFEGSTAMSTSSFQTSDLQNCERISICCFKLPTLW